MNSADTVVWIFWGIVGLGLYAGAYVIQRILRLAAKRHQAGDKPSTRPTFTASSHPAVFTATTADRRSAYTRRGQVGRLLVNDPLKPTQLATQGVS